MCVCPPIPTDDRAHDVDGPVWGPGSFSSGQLTGVNIKKKSMDGPYGLVFFIYLFFNTKHLQARNI